LKKSQSQDFFAEFGEKKCGCGEVYTYACGMERMDHFWFNCDKCNSTKVVLKGEWRFRPAKDIAGTLDTLLGS
jgi:hypothetical protein